MKNIILLILFLIITFVLNVIFYYNSSDYRNFLKGLKNDETYREVKTDTDDLTNIKEKIENLKNTEKKDYKKEKEIIENIKEEVVLEEKNIKEEIKLGKNYTDLLEKFSSYDLEPLTLNTNLFDITNEYPDEYFEYYSRDVTLYFFPSKSYDDVLDVFNVLKLELPFTVNEANNFGEKSFYINLDKDIDDSIVRMVIKYKSLIFGLKIKKNEYNNIRNILEKLN